ncbi:MAG: peptidoglycan editing factor PgeF [bacterium]|jgi:YfiH family protein
MTNFTRREEGELVYYAADGLESTGLVRHGFSTRHGGVSRDALASLNLGFKNDEVSSVLENRRRFLTALGLDPARLVTGQQVHGTVVAEVTARDVGRGALRWEDGFPATDALVTSLSGVPIAVATADCVPILYLDPVKKAIGAAHAGWRGSVRGIAQAVVTKLRECYGSNPEDILAAIGPSIGPCCYEVDERVMIPLQDNFPFWRRVVEPRGDGHWFLNLWELNRRVLVAAGVLERNIAVGELCTSCQVLDFFSYRAEKGFTGSLAAVIALKEDNKKQL